jgi:hypothetical protein
MVARISQRPWCIGSMLERLVNGCEWTREAKAEPDDALSRRFDQLTRKGSARSVSCDVREGSVPSHLDRDLPLVALPSRPTVERGVCPRRRSSRRERHRVAPSARPGAPVRRRPFADFLSSGSREPRGWTYCSRRAPTLAFLGDHVPIMARDRAAPHHSTVALLMV